MNEWSVIYKRAIQDDGSLLFPERLTKEFLVEQRKIMGSYLFANNYQNEVIPDDAKSFRPEWLRRYDKIPDGCYRFAFIDPAIGQKKHHDFTAITIIDADYQGNWYLRVANRYKITPTEIIEKLFQIQGEFKCNGIGIEIVAYQEALLYMLDQEMRRRQVILPVKGIKRTMITKESRILGLVPKFEWGRLFIAPGLVDFEDEYSTFPRGSHDDILDSLASLDEIVFYPQKQVVDLKEPRSKADPEYERWYIKNLGHKKSQEQEED